MKNLFEPAAAAEIRSRIERLGEASERQWGTMSAGQAMAHCAVSMEMALGDNRPRRMAIGRVIGGLIKRKVLATDDPIGRNSPTAPDMVVKDARDLDRERQRMLALMDRFTASNCTSHPHPFFGRLAPDEWAVLMYKHLDHHLRQFGA